MSWREWYRRVYVVASLDWSNSWHHLDGYDKKWGDVPVSSAPIYIIGSGGHSRSLQSLIKPSEAPILTIGPQASTSEEEFLSQKFLDSRLFNGIGFYDKSLDTRIAVYERYVSAGFTFENIIASSSVVKSAIGGIGIQIFEQAYVGPHVSVGDNVVVNTSAVVEHDSTLGDSCFISPGALVLGSARVGKAVFIGAGAVVFPGVSISNGKVVPAGVTVAKDL
jgi:UDP-4-amino-4,6-dideoxy-N-acetyl-beta-L-idosamine acetyltransferase